MYESGTQISGSKYELGSSQHFHWRLNLGDGMRSLGKE